ncbi:MAG: DUF2490 domain-containing protein [Nitrospirales bacterium]|nr:DUF2490 domain-containing protein [Nitrospira sp.]MDR4501124.1 DUF2490 domain-containing protein [Nitrospirales bacterium]
MLVIIRFITLLIAMVFIGGLWADKGYSATDHDGQLWFPIYNRVHLPNSFLGWIEVNPRFGHNISEIDQLLLRPALGYQISPSFSIWQGYAWVTNYEPRFLDEHRLYQQLSFRQAWTGFRMSSRTRFEERFIRDARGTALRAREMIRGDIPFGASTGWGLVIYDEIFVNLNTLQGGPKSGFDQNRVFIGVSRRWTNFLSMDVGYQNQAINRRRGPNSMNHIILAQWFIDWGKN